MSGDELDRAAEASWKNHGEPIVVNAGFGPDGRVDRLIPEIRTALKAIYTAGFMSGANHGISIATSVVLDSISD